MKQQDPNDINGDQFRCMHEGMRLCLFDEVVYYASTKKVELELN